MTDDEQDVTAAEALQVAQRALAKLPELERDVEELREDLTAVELRLSEIDDERSYESLTHDEKVGIVREHAFDEARSNHRGRHVMDYNAIGTLFKERHGARPSAWTCYQLIEDAAEAEGFDDQDPSDGNRRLVVDADVAIRSRSVLSPKNRAGGGTAR